MDSRELQRLVDLIGKLVREADERLGERPDWSADREGWRAYDDHRNAEMRVIKAHLTSKEGARFSHRPAYEASMKLAGIRTSCTGGEWGLLRNWQSAARRRVQQEAAGQ